MEEIFSLSIPEKNGYVNPFVLIEKLEGVISLMKKMQNEICPGEVIKWRIVRASMSSPLEIGIAGVTRRKRSQGKARAVAREVHRSLQDISAKPSLPRRFNIDMLETTRKLVAKNDDDASPFILTVLEEAPLEVSSKMKENVKTLIESNRTYQDIGSIEGLLENILTHNRYCFQMWETLTNHKVDCLISEPHLALAHDYLRKRVAVYGYITYKEHRPVSIKVLDIRPLRQRTELPQLDDLGEVNISGDNSPEDFVRLGRDA